MTFHVTCIHVTIFLFLIPIAMMWHEYHVILNHGQLDTWYNSIFRLTTKITIFLCITDLFRWSLNSLHKDPCEKSFYVIFMRQIHRFTCWRPKIAWISSPLANEARQECVKEVTNIIMCNIQTNLVYATHNVSSAVNPAVYRWFLVGS